MGSLLSMVRVSRFTTRRSIKARATGGVEVWSELTDTEPLRRYSHTARASFVLLRKDGEDEVDREVAADAGDCEVGTAGLGDKHPHFLGAAPIPQSQ
jgi:hypothetical protein